MQFNTFHTIAVEPPSHNMKCAMIWNKHSKQTVQITLLKGTPESSALSKCTISHQQDVGSKTLLQ